MSSAKINDNLYTAREEKKYVELTKNGGYFSKFAWKEDPFDLFLEKEREERFQKAELLASQGKKPFRSHPLKNARHKH